MDIPAFSSARFAGVVGLLVVMAGVASPVAVHATSSSEPQLVLVGGRSVAIEELNPYEVLALFRTLPAPTIEEMDGEYSAQLLRSPTFRARLFSLAITVNPVWPGIWISKSFHPTGPNEGRGYNTGWSVLYGDTHDLWPMLTNVGPSIYDGQPSFRMVYGAFDNMVGDAHMLDEVRRLPDGRYLGIGRAGKTAEERSLPMPFLLVKKIGPYRQDVGTPRPGFDMGEEFRLYGYPESAYESLGR